MIMWFPNHFLHWHVTSEEAAEIIRDDGLVLPAKRADIVGEGIGEAAGIDREGVYLANHLSNYGSVRSITFLVTGLTDTWLTFDEDVEGAYGSVRQTDYEPHVRSMYRGLGEYHDVFSESGMIFVAGLISDHTEDEFFTLIQSAPLWVRSALTGSVKYLRPIPASQLTEIKGAVLRSEASASVRYDAFFTPLGSHTACEAEIPCKGG